MIFSWSPALTLFRGICLPSRLTIMSGRSSGLRYGFERSRLSNQRTSGSISVERGKETCNRSLIVLDFTPQGANEVGHAEEFSFPEALEQASIVPNDLYRL